MKIFDVNTYSGLFGSTADLGEVTDLAAFGGGVGFVSLVGVALEGAVETVGLATAGVGVSTLGEAIV